MDGAAEPQGGADRELQRQLVRDREGAREAEADRADIGVGRGAERRRAAAKHLGHRAQLHVRLEPDDGLPGAGHYASSPAGTARSRAQAASSLPAPRQARAPAWTP